jgi:hypothetical protein
MANSHLITRGFPCLHYLEMGIQQQGLGFGMGIAFCRHWLKIREEVTLNKTLDRSDLRQDYTYQL